MGRASQRLVFSLITVAMLAGSAGYAAASPPESPVGSVETVMAKRAMATEGYLLTAWLPRATVARGDEIHLWLVLRNVSQGVLTFQRTCPEADFPLVVQDSSGKTLSPSKEVVTISCMGIEMQPGESLVRDYWLDRLYDLPPGRYSITATATVRRGDGCAWTDVVANTVTVIVTGAAASQPARENLGAVLFREDRLDLDETRSVMARRSAPLGGFRLTSELVEARVFSGWPVELRVGLNNLSSETLTCWETSRNFDTDVGFIVEGPNGSVVPKEKPRHWPLDGRIISIPAKATLTRSFYVNQFYDLSQVGEYRITAVRRLPGPTGWAYIVSNTVVLTVLGVSTARAFNTTSTTSWESPLAIIPLKGTTTCRHTLAKVTCSLGIGSSSIGVVPPPIRGMSTTRVFMRVPTETDGRS